MIKAKFCLETASSTVIFDDLMVKFEVEELFKWGYPMFEERMQQVRAFLKLKDDLDICNNDVFERFKEKFLTSILKDAVIFALSSACGEYDILKHVKNLLKKKRLNVAIKGQIFVDAVIDAIADMGADTALAKAHRGSKIYLLQVKFLEWVDSGMKNKNYCGECGCSCVCDEGCEGDVDKCNSVKAALKGCNHCCDCYIGPMAEKFREREM